MKVFATSLACAVVLAALGDSVFGGNPAPTGKIRVRDVAGRPIRTSETTLTPQPSKTGAIGGPIKDRATTTGSVLKGQRPTGSAAQANAGATIKSFNAWRFAGGGMALTADLQTTSLTPLDKVHYSFTRTVNGVDTYLQSGDVTVPADGKPITVKYKGSAPKDKMIVKISVQAANNADSVTKSTTLPDIHQFVLRYECDDWVVAFEESGKVNTNQLIAKASRDRQEELVRLGFTPDLHVDRDSGFLGLGSETFKATLKVTCPKEQKKLFRTEKEAQQFDRYIRSLIKDDLPVWSRISRD